MSDGLRRVAFVAIVAATLAGIGLAEPGPGRGASGGTIAPNPFSTAADAVVPPAGVESSAWFCAGGTGPGGAAAPTVVLTNTTARTVTGTLAVVPSQGQVRSVPVAVPGDDQIGVAAADGTSGDAVAVTVVLDGGGVGVSQVVSGPLGVSSAPCATTTATRWYFANGSTSQGDTLTLALFNPTTTTAVVNVSLVSPAGVQKVPPAYQGIDVPGDSLTVENVGDHALDDPAVATEVTTLSGAVVAAELQVSDQPGAGGASVVLGADAPSSTWSFAQNTDLSNGSNVFHVFNPSAMPAKVTVRIGLQQGQAEPLTMQVPAGGTASLVAQDQTRIPTGTPYAVTFDAQGGGGIVVDRHVASPPGAPSPQIGDVSGVAGGADGWIVPAVQSPGTGVWALAVVDVGASAATVTVDSAAQDGLVPVTGFAHRRLLAGSLLVIGLNRVPPIGGNPVVVSSSAPVAVECDGLPAGSPGVVAIPSAVLH